MHWEPLTICYASNYNRAAGEDYFNDKFLE